MSLCVSPGSIELALCCSLQMGCFFIQILPTMGPPFLPAFSIRDFAIFTAFLPSDRTVEILDWTFCDQLQTPTLWQIVRTLLSSFHYKKVLLVHSAIVWIDRRSMKSSKGLHECAIVDTQVPVCWPTFCISSGGLLPKNVASCASVNLKVTPLPFTLRPWCASSFPGYECDSEAV